MGVAGVIPINEINDTSQKGRDDCSDSDGVDSTESLATGEVTQASIVTR